MPSTIGETVKRKRRSETDNPKKRPKSSQDDAAAQILLMEGEVLESKKHYNNIITLLENADDFQSEKPEAMLAAIALCRIFVRLLAKGALASKKGASEKDLMVATWLRDQYSRYKSVLGSLLRHEPTAGNALTLSMKMLKAEAEYFSDTEAYSFPKLFLKNILSSLFELDSWETTKEFIEVFAEEHDDIRFYTFEAIKSIIEDDPKGKRPDGLFDTVFPILHSLDGVPESAEELSDFYVAKPQDKKHPLLSIHRHRRQGQDAWLAALGLVTTDAQTKQVLEVLSTVIAPWFTKPELLADFLTNAYRAGGSLSLLALSGVFYLIQHRNIDYPAFYHNLYALLDTDMLHTVHRSRFMRLLETFLASTHLPAALVASFVKRLARRALSAPPAAIVFVVPCIYNLLKSHPLCSFMLHTEVKDEAAKQKMQETGFVDPFDAAETDPMRTRAMESSLWEVMQLQSHYHPNVGTIAKIVTQQFTKQAYNLEDFLDHSYASVSGTESRVTRSDLI